MPLCDTTSGNAASTINHGMGSLYFSGRKATVTCAHAEVLRILCPLTQRPVPLAGDREQMAQHAALLFVLDASAGLYRHIRADLAERLDREAHGVLATHPGQLEPRPFQPTGEMVEASGISGLALSGYEKFDKFHIFRYE